VGGAPARRSLGAPSEEEAPDGIVALGTLYFIPLHGMAKDQRKSLVKEALAARSPGPAHEDVETPVGQPQDDGNGASPQSVLPREQMHIKHTQQRQGQNHPQRRSTQLQQQQLLPLYQ
jgi:hypothetical protein